jgi:nicotinamidase-related amidase
VSDDPSTWWPDLLTDRERLVLERAGYRASGTVSWGRRPLGVRPAVLVIDMQRNALGRNAPIEEAVLDYPQAMGERAHVVIPALQTLLHTARDADVPVLFTRLIPAGRDPQADEFEIIDQLAPREREAVYVKQYASSFFQTALAADLVQQRADTVIIAGNSTSGCVRASAVDAQQLGFAPVVVPECSVDRIEMSHRVALLDLWMKYALVEPLTKVCAYLRAVHAPPCRA